LKKVKAFQVVRGTTDKGPFEPVSKELDIDVYEYYDLMPIPTAYYKVRAIDKHGSMAYSVPVLTQLTDSIPPSPPTGLKGIVDSLGIVKVTWNANEEDDIYGYRIYRANAAHEEYSQLTVAPVLENQFTDTISLKTLTKNIFYKVMAIDKRQNYSKFSKPVKIQRPDIVPPSAPRIVNMDQQTDKVCFRVIPSASSDVKEYILQRKENNEDNWNIVERYNTPIDSLVCNMDIPQKGKYSYTLQAIDSSGLFSEVTQELSVVFNESNCLQINNLQAKSNPSEQHVKLSWELPACANTYVIYKGTQQRPLTMYKRTDNNTPEFIDKQVSPGDSLNYVIKAISISNSQGNAKQIEILY
ncbi:MAG: fibronectin type III domain-containing protein, partial [Bacteroidales bacterium]|nr:fibronectin type III domain-containing protein [Bacteroidales bacterium]